jgi:hypothetical protein
MIMTFHENVPINSSRASNVGSIAKNPEAVKDGCPDIPGFLVRHAPEPSDHHKDFDEENRPSVQVEGNIAKQPHPYANLFPMMKGEAFRELVASIRDDGLEQPIVTFEGKVFDGRNRALACSNAQVKPRYVKYKGDDPLGFVVRSNLHRRHLTTSQRAAVAAELANLEHGQKTADTANA